MENFGRYHVNQLLSKPSIDEVNKTQIIYKMKLYTITFQKPLSISM